MTLCDKRNCIKNTYACCVLTIYTTLIIQTWFFGKMWLLFFLLFLWIETYFVHMHISCNDLQNVLERIHNAMIFPKEENTELNAKLNVISAYLIEINEQLKTSIPAPSSPPSHTPQTSPRSPSPFAS